MFQAKRSSAARGYFNQERNLRATVSQWYNWGQSFDFAKVMTHVDDVVQGVYRNEHLPISRTWGLMCFIDPSGKVYRSKPHIDLGIPFLKSEILLSLQLAHPLAWQPHEGMKCSNSWTMKTFGNCVNSQSQLCSLVWGNLS